MWETVVAAMISFCIMFSAIAGIVAYRYMYPQKTLPVTCNDLCGVGVASAGNLYWSPTYVSPTGKRIPRRRLPGAP